MTDRETGLACHELLLRLAGRLPDEQLWRYRDWLSGDAADVVALSLPGVLLRERTGLDDADHRLLADALLPLGADPAVVDSILPGADSGTGGCTFTAEAPVGGSADSEVLVLGATLRGRPGIGEVRSSWRRRPGSNELRRVLLVSATTDFIELTGEIQRILRALGEPAPRVEVLPSDMEPTAYHRAALAESVLVCAGSEELAVTAGRS
ncbi:hypothetical protein FHX42_004781 [Saccharopolyspora lacisalsi]|uniref:Uncharacterized protein n=1 Tax=Halosaccharopolyspora lacisalsi TaxID=1000566 RepID=A0A839E692_9PSEU|nr:hypothetical protein [Halosaccharopolyspora lacisalsi]MBA8827385.1 hypothetical protein [Halosaccharopolyspora lacisalsi]